MAEEGEAPVDTDGSAAASDSWLEEREGLDAAVACVGSKLDEADGASVGKVEAALRDAEDGSPTWLVVKLGRFGKRAAVPFDYAAPGVGHVWTPFSRETIRGAAELDPEGGLSAADERALASHYGIPAGSGRIAAVADRGDEDPGSVPV